MSVIVVCWSPKGGSGTSVVAAATALVCARRAPVVLADLGGDQPALLGLAPADHLGIAHWLAAQPAPPPDALARLARPVAAGVDLLPYGTGGVPDGPGGSGGSGGSGGPDPSAAGAALADALGALSAPVVVDGGCSPPDLLGALAERAATVAMVVRPCYLALRRAVQHPALVHTTHVVLVEEPGRAITAADVRSVTGVDVVVRLRVRATTARAVDAGLFPARVPDELARALAALAPAAGALPPAPEPDRRGVA